MLYINFTLTHPLFLTDNNFTLLATKSGTVSQNKAWEIEAVRNCSLLLKFELTVDWKGRDHAGPSLTVGLLGYEAALRIYDIRHWDYRRNNWEDRTIV